MGWNTSMIILNDCLDQIAKDAEFGKKVSRAASALNVYGQHQDVTAGCCGNAATVIETHHADSTSVIAFGGNRGIVLSAGLYAYGTEDENVRILRELADQLGYSLRKKS